MEKLLAQRTTKIDASGIRKVFALAQSLENPVNLSIGQPDFDVPDQLKEAAIQAIRDGFNKYSQSPGDMALREKISDEVRARTGWQNPHTMITSGVSGGLLLSFMSLIDPGDEVIIPDPYFVIYKHIVNMLGGKCVFIDTYPDFDLHVDSIAAAITDKTKLIIVNSPCNPTGKVYPAQTLKKLAQVADKSGIPIMSDEIYDKFSYDGHCPSIAEYYDKTLILGGFGKAYAMTGWRLGYASVSEKLAGLLEEMVKIQQYTFVCPPTPFQQAAIAAMDYDISPLVDKYRRKRDMVYQGLKDTFEVTMPAGAFYAFIKAPEGISATDFVAKAIKNNCLIIPGNVFSEKDTHFRLSYAAGDETIQKGIEILKKLA